MFLDSDDDVCEFGSADRHNNKDTQYLRNAVQYLGDGSGLVIPTTAYLLVLLVATTYVGTATYFLAAHTRTGLRDACRAIRLGS